MMLYNFLVIIVFSFRKKRYKARKLLTAIDWNYHFDLNIQSSKYGEVSCSHKCNQRTKTWNVILKEKKDYGYIFMLLAKVFRLRFKDQDNVLRVLPMDADMTQEG